MGMIPDVNDAKVIIIGSAVILVTLYLFSNKISDAVVAGAETVGDGLNPVDKSNWFNKGADALYDAIKGEDDDSLTSIGDDLFDWMNPPTTQVVQ